MTPKKTSLTLAQLTDTYVQHMESSGKSRGTCFSYESELRLAQRELGADTRIGALTRDDITVFNNCPRVTTLKSGGAKSQLSIDKSRRVLRLALAWAAENKLIDASPAEPIEATEKPTKKRGAKAEATPAPEAKPTKRGAKKTDATPVDEPAAPEKKRKRRGAIVLEVAQDEAERAADAAEAMVAESAS